MAIWLRSDCCVALRDILAVDQDPPAGDVVEPLHQLYERGLAGAGAADQADALAGADIHRQPDHTAARGGRRNGTSHPRTGCGRPGCRSAPAHGNTAGSARAPLNGNIASQTRVAITHTEMRESAARIVAVSRTATMTHSCPVMADKRMRAEKPATLTLGSRRCSKPLPLALCSA